MKVRLTPSEVAATAAALEWLLYGRESLDVDGVSLTSAWLKLVRAQADRLPPAPRPAVTFEPIDLAKELGW